MRRPLLSLLLILALVFQGWVAVAAEALPHAQQQQHCAMHDVQGKDCPCCPDGGAMGAACTVQCSTAQVPAEFHLPAQVDQRGTVGEFAARAILDRSYLPLVPPPIR